MMTDLASPSRATGPAARDAASDRTPSRGTGIVGLYTAMMVAIGAATVGLVGVTALVLVAWGADSGNNISAVTALRAAGQAWLLAHHSPIGTDSGTIGLVPIGLMALPVGLLARAGILLGRANAPIRLLEAGRLVLALAATYGVIAALLSFGTGTSVARVGSLSAVLGAVLVAAAAGGVGVVHGAELSGPLLTRLPAATPVVLRAAALAVAVLVAAGAVLVGAALALHGGQTVALAHSLGGGVVGGVMVLLLCVLYAPNAVVCGLSYAVGPGFAVGTGTSVTAFGAHLGPVPAFPLLGALPAGTRAAPMSWPILVAPLLAGVLAGMVVGRSRGGLRAVLGCAVLTGVGVAALAGLAGGPLGAGRLAAVGPSLWKVGGAAFVEIAVVGLLTMLLVRRNAVPPELPAEPAESAAEAPAAEAPAPRTAKSDTAKSGTAKSDTAKSGTAKSDAADSDTAKSDKAKSDTAKSDTAKSDTAKVEADKPAADETEADKADVEQAEPKKAESAKAESAKPDSRQAEPAKAEAEPGKAVAPVDADENPDETATDDS